MRVFRAKFNFVKKMYPVSLVCWMQWLEISMVSPELTPEFNKVSPEFNNSFRIPSRNSLILCWLGTNFKQENLFNSWSEVCN